MTKKRDDQKLQLSNDEQLAAFKRFKVAHKRMVEVTNEVKAGCRYLDSGCFILVVGPPGIGKTTVLEGVYNSLIRSYMSQMLDDPGFIPAIKITVNAEDNRFDWKQHWKDLLRELQEPLIDHKTLPKRDIIEGARMRIVDPDGGGSRSLYRQSYESAARNRRLLYCFNDEAHHFTLVPIARMFLRQHEVLKSSAERSRTIFALFGTYDLLKLRNANGQLGRRTKTIHFQRYKPIDEDLTAFAEAAMTLLANMPLRQAPIFSNKDLDNLFEMSLGCVGLLKDILVATLDSVLEAGDKSLTISDVIKHELPTDVMDRVSREIINAEDVLIEDETKRQLKRDIIRMRLERGAEYLTEHPDEQMPLGMDEAIRAESPQPPHVSKKQPKGRRRVECSPQRHPVGEGRKRRTA